jgi:hypothetical protein
MRGSERAVGHSRQKRWWTILLGLFGLAVGVSAPAATNPAASERAALEARVAAVREALQQAPQEAVGRHSDFDLIAQWPNWPNWGNWGNWPNWPNWGNWFNR